MAITYPVDVANTRWAVCQVSTGIIISRNKSWPRADGGPIDGLDPDYVYLLHITDTQPSYDSRLYRLVGTEAVDVPANELRLTWATEAQADSDRIEAAENEEAAAFSTMGKLEREAIQTRLMVGAILAYIVDQQQFPAKIRAMAVAYKKKATRMWQNRDRLQEVVAQIEAGADPDLDTGWEKGELPNEE